MIEYCQKHVDWCVVYFKKKKNVTKLHSIVDA